VGVQTIGSGSVSVIASFSAGSRPDCHRNATVSVAPMNGRFIGKAQQSVHFSLIVVMLAISATP
jgi:hypothetical protein